MGKAIARAHFVERVFTEAERSYAEGRGRRPETYAGIFAAKEAVSKALRTGFDGFSLKDIEITHDERRAPHIVFHNHALSTLEKLGASRAHVSISHDGGMAIAFAVIEE